MAYENLSQIIKLAASTENTPELQTYWEQRYTDLLNRGLFQISSKTLTLLADDTQITKPATPFGDIVLVNHLDKNLSLDEITLQTTLESSVRFLDSLVDKINFTPEAKYIVTQYRKIGLGLYDFKDYLSSRKSSSDLDEIDYIGSLVSSGSYRASESLAEEKGVCTNWDKIKKHLRPKSFEYWYDVSSGEVKSGLEIAEDFDQQTILNSGFEIIPRRNSNILLFPTDLEWQIWSDRDSTAAKTEISHLDASPALENNISKKIEVQDTNLTQTSKTETPSEIASQEQPTAEIPKTEEISAISIPDLSVLPDLTAMPSHSMDTDLTSAPGLLPEVNPEQDAVESGHELSDELAETELLTLPDSPDLEQLVEENDQTNLNLANPITQPTLEDPQFQIGELVTVQSPVHTEFNHKIFQVIDFIQEANLDNTYSLKYKLTGDDLKVEPLLWSESELVPVELVDILSKINNPQQNPEPLVEITEAVSLNVHALITMDDKILLENIDNSLDLPGGMIPKNTSPEVALEELMFEKYGITGTSNYEIGTAISKSDDQMPSKIHLGFIFTAQNVDNPELKWYEKKELAKASKYVLGILVKLENQKKYFTALNQSNIAETNSGNVTGIQQMLESNVNVQSVVPEVHTQAKANDQVKKLNLLTNLNMNKYILKLEQLLQTESFGKIRVSLEYDSKGARSLMVHGDEVSPELETLLSTVLNLVNFSLGKNTSPAELANLLEMQTQSGGALGNLLKIVSEVLQSAPGSITEITPDIIADSLQM